MLIFCSSRKGCESTARHVAKFLKSFIIDVHENDCEFADITAAIDSLRKCPAGLDPILEETLPSGVAFHHAGLTVIVFFLFRVMASTNTVVTILFFVCRSSYLISSLRKCEYFVPTSQGLSHLFCCSHRLRKERLLKPVTGKAFYVS